MKDISEVTALVVDYGTFTDLAGCLATKCKKVYYFTPWEEEYRDINKCCLGGGQEKVERCDEPLDPDFIKNLDLACFPDIGFIGMQKLYRSMGVAVWGSFGVTNLEQYRTRFLTTLKDLGLEVAPYEVIKGFENLKVYLKDKRDLWIKVNRFRANMETWHYQDWDHAQNQFRKMAQEFGGLESEVVFVIQKPIPDAQEIGYDGLNVDGQFPGQSFQGYEAKNELYLGSLLDNEELPECVQAVNEAWAPVLREAGYQNFWATEIRKVDDTFHFIDPTARQAGQTMEHYYLNCSNLPEVIWAGANGELVTPEFLAPFSAEATLHHKDGDGGKVLCVPEEARDHVKLYHFCEGDDGLYHFPPGKNDEVGVVIGLGESVEEALEDLKEHFELLEDEPVEIRLHAFADLLEQIEEAESDGMEFGDDDLPEPEIALQ
jgi:hypothetical protein